jgi:hypothetical protein
MVTSSLAFSSSDRAMDPSHLARSAGGVEATDRPARAATATILSTSSAVVCGTGG